MSAVRRAAVYALYLVAVLIPISAAVHRRYLRRITPAAWFEHGPQPATIDALTLSRVGYLEAPRRSSFANFPLAKPPGTIRIGCFGDSFTYGTEVLDGDEYAAVMADLMHAAGHPEVQVLNFGNPGLGLHQTYLMWDLVGRRYGLDAVVVLALPRLWVIRDVTFTFWNPPAPTLGFHARYVLDGDGLALVDVLGGNERERFAAYNRLLPPWRYLRFDRKPPAFLRAWLGPDRTIRNPFYYRRDGPTDEALESYRRLLPRFAAAGVPVLLWDAEGGLLPPGAEPASLALRRPVRDRSFLYEAPADHPSRWGQRLVAEETVRVFGAGADAPIPHVSVRDFDAPVAAPVLRVPGDYREAAVTLDDLPVARFFEYHRGNLMAGRLARLPADVRGLLAVPLPGKTIVDALFLPLHDGRAAPEVVVRDGTRLRPLPVARLDDPRGSFRLFRIELCSGTALADILPVPDGAECAVPPSFGMLPRAREVAVLVDGDELLRVALTRAHPPEDAPTLELRPTDRYFKIRSDALARTLPEQLGHDGVVDLVLDAPDGDRARLPLARWARDDEPAPATWAELRRLLGGAAHPPRSSSAATNGRSAVATIR